MDARLRSTVGSLAPVVLFLLASCASTTSTDVLTSSASDSIQTKPQPVAGNLTATAVDAGWRFACAVEGDGGGSYCWGMAQQAALGSDTQGKTLTQPNPVTGGGNLVTVSARWGDACSLDGTGAAYCWGDNTYGEVGADSTDSQVYAATAVGTDLRFTQVATGMYQACGLTAAGGVYCWGNGATIGAGDGFESIHTTPERVLSDRTFVQISAGQAHTCALDDTGAVWCWGRNRDGELGDGETGPSFVTTPQQVVGGRQFVSIAAGGFHVCGLTSAGEAWCWGDAGYGQLGDGSPGSGHVGNDHVAEPVAVAGGHTFSRLFGGYYHTCGLSSDGTAFCWGLDNTGQLGIGSASTETCGTAPCITKPTPVAGGLKFSTLGTGSDLTCGVTPAGQLYCWGWKEALGTG